MKKVNSPDPAKYLPELAKISYQGASGKIEFDEKGDRKDAEMTIFTMKGGKIEPIAIIKSGKTTKFEDFLKAAEPAAPAAAPADAAKAVEPAKAGDAPKAAAEPAKAAGAAKK